MAWPWQNRVRNRDGRSSNWSSAARNLGVYADQRHIEAFDRQIDALVYELYDLSAKEIVIVEAASK